MRLLELAKDLLIWQIRASDTEGRYGDGAARTKVRSPKPKALFYHGPPRPRIDLVVQTLRLWFPL